MAARGWLFEKLKFAELTDFFIQPLPFAIEAVRNFCNTGNVVQRTNDEWLTALQQSGDAQREALSELREYLLRAVYVYLRDRRPEMQGLSASELHELAEDFAQDALLAIRDNLDKFRGDAKFTTWAYRFVINTAASELRQQRRSYVSLDDLVEQGTAVLTFILESDTKLDPETEAGRREFITIVLNIINNELTERQRIAILGIYFQDMSIQEVAQLLETSPNVLYKTLHEARKKIKASLLDHHYGPGDILGLFEGLW